MHGEIVTQAETQSQTLNQLSHPGAPEHSLKSELEHARPPQDQLFWGDGTQPASLPSLVVPVLPPLSFRNGGPECHPETCGPGTINRHQAIAAEGCPSVPDGEDQTWPVKGAVKKPDILRG